MLRKINLTTGVHLWKKFKATLLRWTHKGSEFTPLAYKAEETKKVFFCACKQTNNQPLCDGSHNKK